MAMNTRSNAGSAPITGPGILGPGDPVLPGRGLMPSTLSVVSPLERLWPPKIPGGPAGNSLGFLNALSHDPAAPLEVITGGIYFLALDPEWTSPAAKIGVSFSGAAPRGSVWHMRPGDSVAIPNGIDRFWIHNADLADQLLGVNVFNRGFCSFLVSRQAGGVLPVYSHRRPSMEASVIATLRDDITANVVVDGLRRIYIEAFALTAGFVYSFAGFPAPWSADLKLVPLGRPIPLNTVYTIGAMDTDIAEASLTGKAIPGYPPIHVPLLQGSDSVEGVARGVVDLDQVHRPYAVQITFNGLVGVAHAGAVIRGEP